VKKQGGRRKRKRAADSKVLEGHHLSTFAICDANAPKTWGKGGKKERNTKRINSGKILARRKNRCKKIVTRHTMHGYN